MDKSKWIWITIVLIIGLIFLIYFWVTIKTLDTPTNPRIVDINGSLYLEWDPPSNANLAGIYLSYTVGLSVEGFLSKQTIKDNKVPLYIGTEPLHIGNKGIPVQFVIVAMGGKLNPSAALNGTLIT